MAEPWSAVPEWIAKAEGQVAGACGGEKRASLVRGVILFRPSSEKVQELAHINLGLPQQTSKCSNLDRLMERNNATPAAAPHHHVATALAYRLEAHALKV